jgi:hypothetical protein
VEKGVMAAGDAKMGRWGAPPGKLTSELLAALQSASGLLRRVEGTAAPSPFGERTSVVAEEAST